MLVIIGDEIPPAGSWPLLPIMIIKKNWIRNVHTRMRESGDVDGVFSGAAYLHIYQSVFIKSLQTSKHVTMCKHCLL